MKILDILIVVSFILIFVSLIFSIIFISNNSSFVNTNISQAYVIVKVTDESGNPIQNARVTVIESKTTHITDNNGQTEKISVPVKIDGSYNFLAPKTFSEITIVAKASGFASHIKYNVKITAGTTRTGIVLTLKQIINENDDNLIISQELPDESFSNLIVNKLARI